MDAIAQSILPLATAYVERQIQAFEDERRDWYENGDGRPSSEGGRGYSFPTCPHGMSRWTDYDNICGPCEDAETVEEMATRIAVDASRAIHERHVWLSYRPADMPSHMIEALVEWSLAPIKNLTEKD